MDAKVPDENADAAASREEGQIIHTRFFEHIRAGIYIGEIGGTTQAANPHLKQVLGYPLDTPDRDVDPFSVDRFSEPKDRTAFLTQLQRDGHVDDYVLQLRRQDGSQAWIEVTASHLSTAPNLTHPAHPGTEPNPAHLANLANLANLVFAMLRDVSGRKRSEDQSRSLYHQLQQAEKMAALGQTISGVAHELNNPLATILSWAERLAERPGDEKTRRGLDVIRSESERAARIVRNLLTFARKRQTTRMMVDLNEVMRETLALRAYDPSTLRPFDEAQGRPEFIEGRGPQGRPEQGRGTTSSGSPRAASRGEQRVNNIRVTQSLAPKVPRVFADAHQIKQVILNLLINAEQAMQSTNGRGSLLVRTWHESDHDSVVFEVKDDGPGMSEEKQAKIFDPFYTTKEVGKGTGLGLSVAYAIVHEHGGRIWVTSQPGQGASFFVEIPVGGQRLESTKPASDPVSLEAFKGRRVLVVEDEPALASAVAEALTDAGFVVDQASDGEEALTAVAHNTYHLVVCDLKMPKLDGMQFYRAMAAAAPALARRVIFVTGAVTGTDAERFLDETACRWLAKPFRLGDLLRAARDTLS